MEQPAPPLPPPAAPTPPAPAGAPDRPSVPTVLVQLLGALGTGIGVLGFVVFFGAAITFIRFREAGLPAAEGVSRVPRNVLLVTGAEFLAPAALAAFLVVAVLYGVHALVGWRVHQQLEAAGAAVQIEHEDAVRAQTRVDELRLALARLWEQRSAVPDDALSSLRETIRRSERAADEAAAYLEDARRTERAAHEREEGLRRRLAILDATVATAVLAALAFGLAVAYFAPIATGQLLLLLGTSVAMAVLSFAVYASTHRFVWFGVAAFVSIGVVFGIAKYDATRNDPRVAPAAILRAGHAPLAGFLVSDTGSEVLVGRFGNTAHGTSMIVIPRDQIDDLVVGESVDVRLAASRARPMLRALCAEWSDDAHPRRSPASPAKRTVRAHLCSARERRTLAPNRS